MTRWTAILSDDLPPSSVATDDASFAEHLLSTAHRRQSGDCVRTSCVVAFPISVPLLHARAAVGPTLHGVREQPLLRVGCARKRMRELRRSHNTEYAVHSKLRESPWLRPLAAQQPDCRENERFASRRRRLTSRRLTPRHMPLVGGRPIVSTIVIASLSPLPVKEAGERPDDPSFPKSFLAKVGFQ